MSSFAEDEIFFDALNEEQLFLADVLTTEQQEEQYFDTHRDDSMLLEALDDFERSQSGHGQFQFEFQEFRPRVNRRFGVVQSNYRMRIRQNENIQLSNVVQEFA